MGETPRVELQLGGTWTDVTSYVRYDGKVAITRGQQNEGSSSLDNSTCTLTLNNHDGRFSPRKPTSPYYGLLGRNTPLRVSLAFGSSYLRILANDGRGSEASCPDSAGLDVTGDLDVRVDLRPTSWAAGQLLSKYSTTGNNRSWAFGMALDRYPSLTWSTNGTATKTATATMAIPTLLTRRALRATLDVDNGAGGWTVTFYTSDSLTGTWTQLGDAVTGTGTTSIFSGNAPVEVGDCATLSNPGMAGYYFGAEVRSGIGGTVKASPDFSSQTAGTTSFADAQGNTWTVGADAEIDDRLYRFHGEVAAWPPSRDISGLDASVTVQASGISRRLNQGEATINSPMCREFSNPARANIKAYWPMEDGAEATQIASMTDGVPPMRVGGVPTLAGYSNWTASDPIPVMAAGSLTGYIPAYTSTGKISVRMFVFMPSGAVTAETSLLYIRTTGTAAIWEVRLLANGNLRTLAWDDSGAAIDDGAGNLGSEVAFDLDSRGFTFLALELTESGSNVNWATSVLDFTNTDTYTEPIPGVAISDTVTGKTCGTVSSVVVGRERALTGVIVGHLAVADSTSAFASTTGAVAAWNGESPTARLSRLCTEESVDYRPALAGAAVNVALMGDQLDKSLPDLLQECADTDGGILYETRDSLGFGFRSRQSMFSQDASLVLSCADHELNEALAPVDDDQRTLNDITVERVAGSSYRVQEEDGPLSILAPPDGVGRYNSNVSLSLLDDTQLGDQAAWRVHLGTVDEARFPKVQVHLYSPEITADLRRAALMVEVGDRLTITDPSPDLPPDDIDQLVLGYSETLDQFEHVISYVCAPYTPWRIGTVNEDEYDRIDTGGSQLAAAATSTATSFSVATTSGPLWTTDASDLPFDVMVAGERVTVTAVSGASSPQTFTVTRSVNGVVKAQESGASVSIVNPVYVAL